MTADSRRYEVYSALDLIGLLTSETLDPDVPLTISFRGVELHYPQGMSPGQFYKLTHFARSLSPEGFMTN